MYWNYIYRYSQVSYQQEATNVLTLSWYNSNKKQRNLIHWLIFIIFLQLMIVDCINSHQYSLHIPKGRLYISVLLNSGGLSLWLALTTNMNRLECVNSRWKLQEKFLELKPEGLVDKSQAKSGENLFYTEKMACTKPMERDCKIQTSALV